MVNEVKSGVIKITDKGIIPVRELDKLVSNTDPILRKTMPYFDFNLRHDAIDIANRLIAVLQANRGLGLAAPQIGIEANVFVAGVDDTIVAYFNPIVVEQSKLEIKLEEGCLSFPQLYLNIKRPSAVVIEYQDYTGKSHTVRYDGMTARIAQHEINHLFGILYTNHVGKTSMMMAKTKQKKLLAMIG